MTPEHSKSTAGARGAPDSLGDRAGVLLKGLVECYLVDGQPVGSKYLSSSSGLGLSPATVRSILAELEHHGFLTSPHTSAGRVPTPRGMRHFVDSLLTVESQPVQAADRLQSDLTAATAESGKLAVAGDWLAEMSHLVGLVRAPRSDCHRLRQVEFVDLGAGHILAVLVTWEGEVHNKLIQPETPCSPGQLEQAANFLNREFVGKTLDVIRSQL
ncbi:MAG: heat-inducible transcriptional repressor HrcA, partial [Gammaproteobacteria bacterium]|nr:heat-inducible transcriptional repressor HrcA [Gammaproteobacteria bacterium]